MSQGRCSFGRCDVALIVPPFADLYQGNLACHLLQAIGRSEGFTVKVVYGNMLFASIIGPKAYRDLLDEGLVLETVFQSHAFGQDAPSVKKIFKKKPDLAAAAEKTGLWLDRMTKILQEMQPSIIGSSSSFEQISASVAILERCIDTFPNVTTIIGGANCEADMAKGLISTGTRIHHVASGESEQTFVQFLKDVLVEDKTPERILHGRPCHNLNALPLPEYDEYFEQREFFFGESNKDVPGPGLPHESSRGCWWGEKHQCTFCGLNGGGMSFREKSADVIVDEITTLFERYDIKRLNMTDNIMPHRYFQTVLPSLTNQLPEDVTIFYEQKANISLDRAIALKNARITEIQPGIESLNTDILTRMNKGTTGALNLKLLRYARVLGIDISWNMLACFPGDELESYQEIAQLIKLIPHLQPPSIFSPLRIDRFSPYYDFPERYGIKSTKPMKLYSKIFPKQTDLGKLAYFFKSKYETGASECEHTCYDISVTTDAWKGRWKKRAKPLLSFVHLAGRQYMLIDSRDAEQADFIEFVSSEQVHAALAPTADLPSQLKEWLHERHLVFDMDGGLQPLATASVDILRMVGLPATEVTEENVREPMRIPAQ